MNEDEPCACGHDREDHIKGAEHSLPICFFCGCLGWKRLSPLGKKLRDRRNGKTE